MIEYTLTIYFHSHGIMKPPRIDFNIKHIAKDMLNAETYIRSLFAAYPNSNIWKILINPIRKSPAHTKEEMLRIINTYKKENDAKRHWNDYDAELNMGYELALDIFNGNRDINESLDLEIHRYRIFRVLGICHALGHIQDIWNGEEEE